MFPIRPMARRGLIRMTFALALGLGAIAPRPSARANVMRIRPRRAIGRIGNIAEHPALRDTGEYLR